MNRKVAFVNYRYPLGVSSMTMNSIRLFAMHGIEVDIYIDKTTDDASPAHFNEININKIIFNSNLVKSRLYRFICFTRRRFNQLFLFNSSLSLLKSFLDLIPYNLLYFYYIEDFIFSSWLKRKLDDKYDYVFTVEARSLIATHSAKHKNIYYNMEMLDWEKDNPLYGKDKTLMKILEYKALRNVMLVAIQNEQRAEKFKRTNNYSNELQLLPVASMGNPVYQTKQLLSEKFNIPSGDKIVIYSGNIKPWAKCLEIVDSVASWPPDYHLVLHTWNKDAFSTDYGETIKKRAKGLPVYFSDEYLTLDELSEYIASADIALMFYDDIDTNFTEILFSSNKLAEYLKAGLPVITSDFPELKRFIGEKGIGCTINSMSELSEALCRIVDNYKTYNLNVINCYQNTFRFENYFYPFLKNLYPSVKTEALETKQ